MKIILCVLHQTDGQFRRYTRSKRQEVSEKVQGYLNCFFCRNGFPDLSKEVPKDVTLNPFWLHY